MPPPTASWPHGVTIFRPETCVIDADVTIAPDTVIEPYVQLLGPTRIGSDCRIRSYSVIQNSTIGDNVTIRNGCILDPATIADGAILGPYSHLRPDSNIGESAHVGNFVETKKVTIGKGSKANHLNYLGDAVIGAGANVGAGAITCNYDGVHKHLTTIGDRRLRRLRLHPRSPRHHRRPEPTSPQAAASPKTSPQTPSPSAAPAKPTKPAGSPQKKPPKTNRTKATSPNTAGSA